MELPSIWENFLRFFLAAGHANWASAQKTVARVISTKNLGVWITLTLVSVSSLAQTYNPQQLKQDVAKFLASHYSQTQHERVEIKVSNLDKRLRLAPCAESIRFTLQDPTGLGGSISVQARCPAPTDWSVHVPAQVLIYQQVPVATRAIARGERLSAADLTSSLLNVSSIRQGYALTGEEIIGKEAKRNIAPGEAFKTSALDAPTAIKRGETVVLQAQAGSIQVMSAGIALADGRLGQKIRVRNSSSERIVTGIVLNQGLVQVL